MSKSSYTPEFRAKIAQEYLNGNCSRKDLSKKYNIPESTIRDWINVYKTHGINAFINTNGNKQYTKDFKIQCVEAVLKGESSVLDVVSQYQISSSHMLREWISLYNANRELKDYIPKREVYMADARRKTTIEERKEIVDYCINHNRDYKGTASIYNVSYSQVYSWVKKYDVQGDDGLTDRRGRHKTDEEVNELERLRRENIRLKRQLQEKDMLNELLKKSTRTRKDVRLGKLRYDSKFIAIKFFYETKNWSINWMCKQLEISRAAYYKWLHREIPKKEAENMKLAEFIKEYDERFNHILGYRRMTSWINHFNHTDYKPKRVHRIMKKLGIHSVIRKKKKKYTSSAPESIAENKLGRDFYACAPNEKWATDVTEFKVPDESKKLYLSVILDLYDRYPVAYVISPRNDNKLVFKTFDKALATNPEAKPLFHSDRGFQYTSKVFQRKLKEHEMEQSMSRVGRCIDNGPTEGFWGIIKTEMYQMYEITNEESLRFAITDYIRFYSEERPQDRYHCKTPLEVRMEALSSEHPAEYLIPRNKRIEKYKKRWCA